MRRTKLAAALTVALFFPCLAAQEGGAEAARARLREMGQPIERLQAAGRHDEAEALARRARELQARTQQDAGREDSAELLERAVAARRVNLEGRRDDEAQAIRERSPDHPAQTELLSWATKLLREGRPDAAERVGRIAEQLQARYRRQQAARERPAGPSTGDLDQRLQRIEEADGRFLRQVEEMRRQRIR